MPMMSPCWRAQHQVQPLLDIAWEYADRHRYQLHPQKSSVTPMISGGEKYQDKHRWLIGDEETLISEKFTHIGLTWKRTVLKQSSIELIHKAASKTTLKWWIWTENLQVAPHQLRQVCHGRVNETRPVKTTVLAGDLPFFSHFCPILPISRPPGKISRFKQSEILYFCAPETATVQSTSQGAI